jgi:hypothetical protein
LNLFIPENPQEKDAQEVKQQHGRSTKHQAFPLGETTDLAWRATIDKFYFTWHGEILNLLV